MKHVTLLFFCIFLSLTINADNSVLKKAELRVLDIGNSYSVDATTLLPLIAKESNLKICD